METDGLYALLECIPEMSYGEPVTYNYTGVSGACHYLVLTLT